MDNKTSCQVKPGQKKQHKISRAFWLILGLICVGLGAIGIVLPLLPTTPLMLAAAGCFCKSSSRMYNWLLNNKWFGDYIKNYREGKGLTAKTKITALSVLWTTILVSVIFFLNRMLPTQLVLPLQIVMVLVAVTVSAHILRLPTFKKKQLSLS